LFFFKITARVSTVLGGEDRTTSAKDKWRGRVKKKLQGLGFTWEEVEAAALDRPEWHQSVVQCLQVDAG